MSPPFWRACFAPVARGTLCDMLTLVLRISTVGIVVIALLDIAGCLLINGSVNVPPLGSVVLLLALAFVTHLATKGREEAARWKAIAVRQAEALRQLQMDLMEQSTLLQLRLHAADLARHTQILPSLLK